MSLAFRWISVRFPLDFRWISVRFPLDSHMVAGVGGWRKCFTIFHEMGECRGHGDLTTCRWITVEFPLYDRWIVVKLSLEFRWIHTIMMAGVRGPRKTARVGQQIDNCLKNEVHRPRFRQWFCFGQ